MRIFSSAICVALFTPVLALSAVSSNAGLSNDPVAKSPGATSPDATAPGATELVAKNLAARGGAALAAIHSLRMVGKLTVPGGFELSFNELKSRATGAVRLELTLQGLTIVQAYDGKEGWQIQPFEGRKDAARMSDDEARALADEALIDGYLLASKVTGGNIVNLGEEDVDGTLAYKLRLIQTDGDEFTYYLDPDTYLEIKIVEKRRLRGAEQQTEYELGDYERVLGAYFPFSIDSGPVGSSQRQQINLDHIDGNVAIDGLPFSQPVKK